MNKLVPNEGLGRFTLQLDLADELALASLPNKGFGSESEKCVRRRFMRLALSEGLATMAKYFEENDSIPLTGWRFAIEPGPLNNVEYCRRAREAETAIERALSVET